MKTISIKGAYNYNEGEDFNTNQDEKVGYEKCDLCSGEAKHYFKKFNEMLCDECWGLSVKENLIELSTKF